jgi:uncharacterized protein YidB (DUF937 family)
MSDNTTSSGHPSMTALLGLLAVAGYQNRDKIAAMLKGFGQGTPASGQPSTQAGAQAPGQSAAQGGQGGLGDLLNSLGGKGGTTDAGALLGGGLGALLERFKQSGQGDVANSWVQSGPNKDIAPPQLEKAIGPDVLAKLAQQTGMSRDEILARLSKELPTAVDKYTPDGRLPTAA